APVRTIELHASVLILVESKAGRPSCRPDLLTDLCFAAQSLRQMPSNHLDRVIVRRSPGLTGRPWPAGRSKPERRAELNEPRLALLHSFRGVSQDVRRGPGAQIVSGLDQFAGF